MDIESLKEKLQNFHLETLQRVIDKKTLNYWINSIQSNKSSYEQFEQYVLTSNEYKDLLCKHFRECFLDYIGFDIDENDYNVFWEQFLGHKIDVKNTFNKDIFNYVSSLPKFDEKYVTMINNIFSMIHKEPCTINYINFYLEKFKNDPSYNIEKLTCDVKNNDHLVQLTQSAEASSIQPDESEDIKEALNYVKELRNVFGSLPDTALFVKPQPVQEKPMKYMKIHIEAFEEASKRPMYVMEYFKYVIEQKHDPTSFTEIYNNQLQQYNKLREILSSFTDKQLSEYEFVKDFIYKVDEPSFFESIIDDIVSSEEYQKCTTNVIVQKYRSLFDEELETNDINYIFGKLKAKKLDKYNDEVSSIIINVKNETDEIISKIFELFMYVLERQPDIYEIDSFVQLFREYASSDSSMDINLKVEKMLIERLEFHEILKKRIKTLYKTMKGKDILPSVLYDLLQKSIYQLDNITMSTIDLLLTKLIDE